MTPEDVLRFWFEESQPKQWFEKDDAFDAAIRARFDAVHEAACAGTLDGWADTPSGALALIIVLDQFSRNLHRGSARAFAADGKALALATRMVDAGHDAGFPPVRRKFFYLPCEHSEVLAVQERSVRLFATLNDPRSDDYAERHRVIVARFGRFPHRNAALGRESTAEELAFLKEPNSSF